MDLRLASSCRILLVLIIAVIGIGSPPLSASLLKPDELLLVYNQDEPQSRPLAEYYARLRGVPAGQLCPIRSGIHREEIPRRQFDDFIREPIRNYLKAHDFGSRIRCIVPFYGVPIRVGPKLATTAERSVAKKWREQLQAGVSHLDQLTLALSEAASQPASWPARQAVDNTSISKAMEQYEHALAAAGQRLESLKKTGQGQTEYRRIAAVIQAVEGMAGMLARAAARDLSPGAAEQMKQTAGTLRANEARINELRDRGLADPAREEARKLILQNYGLAGYLRSIAYDLALINTDETTASVDSELALVRWDEYILYRWIYNPLSWRVRSDPAKLSLVTPRQREQAVLMTCRIDGSSIDVARRIIDDSLTAERVGLWGKVYIDARGLKQDNGNGAYDQDLRELATLLAGQAKLTVGLDNAPGVIGPGARPDAMLYCGWYSLRRFVDAFQFVPGAVAYHIASFEAVSLKKPQERGWVKGLLDDGVAATLGPVAEPYLHSFPRPRDFFGLLVTGRFTLAECYAYTNELNSWMMLFIGDPLYRPFARHPRLRIEQIFPAELIPPEFRAGARSLPAGSGENIGK